jgi:hypothetical protein
MIVFCGLRTRPCFDESPIDYVKKKKINFIVLEFCFVQYHFLH